MRNVYAYGIMQKGKKRIGGTVTADTMEQAAHIAAKRDKLVMDWDEDSMIPMPTMRWPNGDKAAVFVWANENTWRNNHESER